MAMTEADEQVLEQARGAARDYANGRPADQVLEELLLILTPADVAPDDMSGFDRWPTVYVEPDLTPCDAEIHSWSYFNTAQVDSYWMHCDLLGAHDEHENSDTGAHWKGK